MGGLSIGISPNALTLPDPLLLDPILGVIGLCSPITPKIRDLKTPLQITATRQQMEQHFELIGIVKS